AGSGPFCPVVVRHRSLSAVAEFRRYRSKPPGPWKVARFRAQDRQTIWYDVLRPGFPVMPKDRASPVVPRRRRFHPVLALRQRREPDSLAPTPRFSAPPFPCVESRDSSSRKTSSRKAAGYHSPACALRATVPANEACSAREQVRRKSPQPARTAEASRPSQLRRPAPKPPIASRTPYHISLPLLSIR
ncbi:MAG: hypothetical protein ACD_75C00278G0008, partial [uncultured bacterium]